MLHLYYFESLLEQNSICYGYKIGPNMMGIQVGYNKNFHIKCIEYYEKFDSLRIVLRYKDGDIRDMLVSSYGLLEILVLKFMVLVTCTYGEPLCDEVGAWFIYWLSSLWVAVGDEWWSFPTNLSPRSMRVILFFDDL